MNQFYEQELPDISNKHNSSDLDSSRDKLQNGGDRQKLTGGRNQSSSVEKRRYMKKDP